jgi:hypothetical protein
VGAKVSALREQDRRVSMSRCSRFVALKVLAIDGGGEAAS